VQVHKNIPGKGRDMLSHQSVVNPRHCGGGSTGGDCNLIQTSRSRDQLDQLKKFLVVVAHFRYGW
jgi:hypothetical protein